MSFADFLLGFALFFNIAVMTLSAYKLGQIRAEMRVNRALLLWLRRRTSAEVFQLTHENEAGIDLWKSIEESIK